MRHFSTFLSITIALWIGYPVFAQIDTMGPLDTTIIKIERIVQQVDTDTNLTRIELDTNQIKELKYYPHTFYQNAHQNPMFFHNVNMISLEPSFDPYIPTALFKDTIIMRLDYQGVTCHFYNENLIRQASSCSMPAGWAYCNGWSHSEFYDYFWYAEHLVFNKAYALNNGMLYYECGCYRKTNLPDDLIENIITQFKLTLKDSSPESK